MPSQTNTSKHDPELWSPDIAFLLCDAGGLLGERGANLESFGETSIDYDKHNDQQLGGYWGVSEEARRNGAGPAEGHARRAYRVRARWLTQERPHRATHLSYYLGRNRAPSAVSARFGMFAGVAVQQWEARYWRKTGENYSKAIDAARDALSGVLDEIAPFERELRAIEQYRSNDRCSGYVLSQDERRETVARRAELLGDVKPLWSKRDTMLATLADLDRATRTGDPLRALLTACQAGEQGGLMKRAEAAVRAAHRAWNGLESFAAVEAVLDQEAV